MSKEKWYEEEHQKDAAMVDDLLAKSQFADEYQSRDAIEAECVARKAILDRFESLRKPAGRERGEEGAGPALGGALGQLRDLRDYLVTLPPELRNDATRKALSQLRFAISYIATRIEPHVASGYMEEKDCRACGLPMDAPIHIGGLGATASSSPQRAFGPIREALSQLEIAAGALREIQGDHESRYNAIALLHLLKAKSALLGEALPTSGEAEQSEIVASERPETPPAGHNQATPGATVQPQARPMRLRAATIGLNLYLYEVNPHGETFIGSICSKLFTAARKEEIAYRINSFEPPHQGEAT